MKSFISKSLWLTCVLNWKQCHKFCFFSWWIYIFVEMTKVRYEICIQRHRRQSCKMSHYVYTLYSSSTHRRSSFGERRESRERVESLMYQKQLQDWPFTRSCYSGDVSPPSQSYLDRNIQQLKVKPNEASFQLKIGKNENKFERWIIIYLIIFSSVSFSSVFSVPVAVLYLNSKS